MIFHIYRPEVRLWEIKDREWVAGDWVTNTLFFPIPDSDRERVSVFLKDVRNGSEPFYSINVPDGSFLFMVNRAMYLKTPDGETYDAINALIDAKNGARGFSFHRPGRPFAVAEPVPPVTVAPLPPREEARPLPPRPKSAEPIKQMSLF